MKNNKKKIKRINNNYITKKFGKNKLKKENDYF